jgi:hypothetical protein
MGGKTIVTMKDFQIQLEKSSTGQVVPVTVSRSGREEFKKIQFQVTIGAR